MTTAVVERLVEVTPVANQSTCTGSVDRELVCTVLGHRRSGYTEAECMMLVGHDQPAKSPVVGLFVCSFDVAARR